MANTMHKDIYSAIKTIFCTEFILTLWIITFEILDRTKQTMLISNWKKLI